jgi:hypothetical protein
VGHGSVEQKVLPKSSAAGYKAGTVVQLTAKADSGWKFVKWKGDLSGTDNPAQITVKEPKEVTAVFEKSYKLTIHTTGRGSVVKSLDQSTYKYKTNVKLTAKPDIGWKFVKWKGDISSTEHTVQVRMDEAKEVTAVFEATENYTLTTSVEGNGGIWVSPPLNTFHYGDMVKLVASADKGNIFVRWEGDLSGSKNPQSLQIRGNTSVKAIFKPYEEELESTLETDPPEGRPPFFMSEARAVLINHLPKDILLKKVIIKNKKDSVLMEENYRIKISSGQGSIFKITSTDPIRLNDFLDYTIEWKCEYQGVDVTKKGFASVGTKYSQVASKAKMPAKIIHMKVNFNKNK